LRFHDLGIAIVSLGVVIAASCAVDSDNELSNNGDGDGNGGANAGGAAGDGGDFDLTGSGGSGGGAVPCDPSVEDFDQDGYTIAEGDCNDCDGNVNPGAIEVPTDPAGSDPEMVDEDCDGETDEVIDTCDSGLAVDNSDPNAAAQAIEICDVATVGGKDYGLLQAFWAHADGTQAGSAQLLQFGIQADFGPNVSVQEGERMMVLSSGFARLPNQAGAAVDHNASAQGFVAIAPPAGFPQNVPGCDGATELYDDIALQVRLRAPTNATGFKFLFKFHSFEFAEYVCTNFNDQFVALVNPPPLGAINGNVTFDSNNNPVSVNIAYFDVCDPVANNDFAAYCFSGCPAPPSPYCPLGASELVGTGFDTGFGSAFPEDAGATSWLQTTAPIAGGEELDIRFATWDTGDNAYDSTVLVDSFGWIAEPGTTVGTQPPPK